MHLDLPRARRARAHATQVVRIAIEGFRSTGAYSERVGRGALHDADVLGDGRRVRFGSHFVGIRHHMTFLLTKFEVSSQAMTTRTMDRMTSPAMS